MLKFVALLSQLLERKIRLAGIKSWIQTFVAIDTFESYVSFNWLNIKVSLVIKLVVSRRPQRHSRSSNLVCSNYLTNSLLRKICDGNGHTNVKNMIINVIFNSTLYLSFKMSSIVIKETFISNIDSIEAFTNTYMYIYFL